MADVLLWITLNNDSLGGLGMNRYMFAWVYCVYCLVLVSVGCSDAPPDCNQLRAQQGAIWAHSVDAKHASQCASDADCAAPLGCDGAYLNQAATQATIAVLKSPAYSELEAQLAERGCLAIATCALPAPPACKQGQCGPMSR
jgi:hypothetical protein